MPRACPTLLTAALAVGVLAADAGAQEPWPFISYEAFRYAALIDNDEDVGAPCCAPHGVAVPGHALIHLSAVIDVPWSEELDRISIYARDLTLTVPGGEPLSPFGRFAYRGIFEASSGSLSASRPNDWPESDQHLLLEAVWALPEDATTATLTVGEHFSTEIEIPQSASEPPSPGDTATFAITAITPVERIDVGTTSYGQGIYGTVSPRGGQIVQVDFTITPLIANWIDNRSGFTLNTRFMQLVGPNGLPAVPLGQHLSQALTSSTTNSISGDFLNKPQAYTFYYLTDGAPGAYTLYFLSDPAAEGRLE